MYILIYSTILARSMFAGCTGLISAGYKITWDKGAEGAEGAGEGEEGGEVSIFVMLW